MPPTDFINNRFCSNIGKMSKKTLSPPKSAEIVGKIKPLKHQRNQQIQRQKKNVFGLRHKLETKIGDIRLSLKGGWGTDVRKEISLHNKRRRGKLTKRLQRSLETEWRNPQSNHQRKATLYDQDDHQNSNQPENESSLQWVYNHLCTPKEVQKNNNLTKECKLGSTTKQNS